MSLPLRVIASAVVFILLTGWLAAVLAQGPQPDVPSTLQQLQETLKRLQAEIKSLQDTVKRLSGEAKKSKASPASVSPASAAAERSTSLQKAMEAYNRGRELEEKKLFRAAKETVVGGSLKPRTAEAFRSAS
jgi:uncharacterized protein YlxW (UPF0749 family)